MKNIFIALFIVAFGLPYTFGQPVKKLPASLLTGMWNYKNGYYSYYDDSNKKLKQSRVTNLQNLNIEVTSETDIKIIYPDRIFYTTYQLSVEQGRHFISLDLGNGLIKYQIVYINRKSVTLKSRHNINFYVDGDINKKAAYTIFTIHMVKDHEKALVSK